nr:MAG TPA: hypothetical protein [Caudoviricetes sp.]
MKFYSPFFTHFSHFHNTIIITFSRNYHATFTILS